MNLYEYLDLHISDDKFYFEPRQPNGDPFDSVDCLVINRTNGEITLQPVNDIPQNLEIKKIVGIYGIIDLVTGPHIVIITLRQYVGDIKGVSIFRIAATEVIPYAVSLPPVTNAQMQENLVYLSMVKTVLGFESYYFSYVYDITHTRQRLQNVTKQFLATPLHQRADQRFVWNAYMLQNLAAVAEAHRFVLPVMLGFVGIRSCTVGDASFQLSLISRRSCFRAGVRLQTRGVDSDGSAANFVESEQILEYGNFTTSFVQIRGSIPTYWTQQANFKWLPSPKVKTELDCVSVFKKHIEKQLALYERMYFINLVNHKGSEKVMRDILEYLCNNAVREDQDVNLISFDFHHECKNMDWTKLFQLITFLDEIIVTFGYFRRVNEETQNQIGIFRTSCMDCLDRTNVVQSLLAKKSLEYQMKFGQIISAEDFIENHTEFDSVCKNLWADNGDAISKQYAGTGALKADFTRIGRRTYLGALDDLKNACTRWVLNNFCDGFRQDAIDFCLGNCAIDKENPLKYNLRSWEPRHYLYIAFAALSVIFPVSIYCAEDVGYEVVAGSMTMYALLVGYMVLNGEELVNRPRLK